MRLKSYHSATVEAAIRLAHIELGDEAVFLGSRRNDVGSDPNQAYEVTFAVMAAEDAVADVAPAPGQASGQMAPQVSGAGDRKAAEQHSNRQVRSATVHAGGPGASSSAAMTGDERAGVVSWKKLLRHVSRRDSSQAPQNGQRETPLQPAVSRSEAPRNGASQTLESAAAGDGATAAPNGAVQRQQNGQSQRGGLKLPHWKEFVPGDQREAETAHEVMLTDASRVIEAGGPPAPAVRPRTLASHNGDANGAHAAAVPAKKKTRNMPPPAEERTAEVYSLQKLGAELEELRRMFERQQAGSAPLVLPSRELLSDTRLAGIYHRLSDNAIEPSLAAELVAGLQRASAEGAEGRRLGALLAEAVRGRFATNSELGHPGASRMAAALVGPSGVGKTTAVAKLAFRCGLLRRRRVHLFSVDPLRVGAVESLQAYADLMNVPLEVVDDYGKLGRALGRAGEGEPELLLIDTPGYGRREWERARRLAETFLGHGDIDVHLVLDLRTKSDDLHRAVENFRMFRPAKLLFTRLDETGTFGTMLNETVRTGLPVSFVSVGQRVPEDIVPAGEPELLRLLLKDRSSN